MKQDIWSRRIDMTALNVGASPLRDAGLYFAATVVLSWLFWLPGLFLQNNGASAAGNVLVALGSFVPLAVAVYLLILSKRHPFDIGHWMRTLSLNGIIVALVMPVLLLIPIILWRLYSGTFDLQQLLADAKGIPVMLPGFFVLAVGEEVGWRGYLLDRLGGFRLYFVNFLVAFAWFIWQIPLVMSESHDVFLGDANQHLAAFLLFSILITPFLNRLSMHADINPLLSSLMRASLRVGFFLYGLQGAVDLKTSPYGAVALVWLAILNVVLFGQLWQAKPSGAESELARVMPLEASSR